MATKYWMTLKERLKRKKARRKIVQAANRYAFDATPVGRAPWSMRDVARCAGICRRLNLCNAKLLEEAGFNPPGRRAMNLSPRARQEIVEFAQAFGAMLVVVAFVLVCVWVAR